jgi:hypothetical protein
MNTLSMDQKDSLGTYATRGALTFRRYCAQLKVEPHMVAPDMRLDILKWILGGLTARAKKIVGPMRTQDWMIRIARGQLSILDLFSEISSIDEVARYHEEIDAHHATVHTQQPEQRRRVNTIEARQEGCDSEDDMDDDHFTGQDDDGPSIFLLGNPPAASDFPQSYTHVYLAGEKRFAAPEDVVKPAARICWSCGAADHISTACPTYHQDLPHASVEQKNRLSRNPHNRNRLVFSNHGVSGNGILKSAAKTDRRSNKGSQ